MLKSSVTFTDTPSRVRRRKASTPSAVPGTLIITFGTVDQRAQPVRALHGRVLLERQVGLHLERDVAVVAVRALPHRAHQVARPLDVGDRAALEHLLHRLVGAGVADVVVVEVRPGHGGSEDRRVRRPAAHAVLGHDPLQEPGLEGRPRDVVVPDALTVLLERDPLASHERTPR